MHRYFIDRGMKDLNPLQYGKRQCPPSHSFGPAIRPFYLIHYVLAGKGVLYKGEAAYPVKAGEYFLIFPDEVTTYTADADEPWEYLWLGFTGERAERLLRLESPVGTLPRSIFEELMKVGDGGFLEFNGVVEDYVASVLHRMIAEMFAHRAAHAHYARRAETILRTMYMQPDISVEQIAKELLIDRHHLARLFKARYGITMQAYLIETRINRAAEFLAEGHSATESAALCGYTDFSNFSKMFRRRFGVSPGKYAKK